MGHSSEVTTARYQHVIGHHEAVNNAPRGCSRHHAQPEGGSCSITPYRESLLVSFRENSRPNAQRLRKFTKGASLLERPNQRYTFKPPFTNRSCWLRWGCLTTRSSYPIRLWKRTFLPTTGPSSICLVASTRFRTGACLLSCCSFQRGSSRISHGKGRSLATSRSFSWCRVHARRN
jgi:hypothetical protein